MGSTIGLDIRDGLSVDQVPTEMGQGHDVPSAPSQRVTPLLPSPAGCPFMSQARGSSQPQGLRTIYCCRRLLSVWKSLAEAGGALSDQGRRVQQRGELETGYFSREGWKSILGQQNVQRGHEEEARTLDSEPQVPLCTQGKGTIP